MGIRRVESKEGREYFVDDLGVKLPSSTTVLNINEKIGLHSWYARTAVESFVSQLIYEMHITGKGMMTKDFLECLDVPLMMKKAKERPEEAAKEGAEKGTIVHGLIEEYFRTGRMESVPPEFKEQVEKFYQWLREYCVEPVGIEERVYSEKHRYAGTLDLVANLSIPEHLGVKALPKKSRYLFVIDFKTANGLYHDHKLQLASYVHAWEERSGQTVDCGAMLRLDKYTGDMEWHIIERQVLDSFFEEFCRFVDIWWLRKERSLARRKKK